MAWITRSSLTWFELMMIKILKTGYIPKHIAIIMDGNRRYAKKNGITIDEGHRKGFDKLAETLHWCLEFGIPEVTVYAFSIENFKRTKEEVNDLMDLAREKFKKLLSKKNNLIRLGIRIRVIGNSSLVPNDLYLLMKKAMRITKDNNKILLNVAFCYSSRDEIINAVKVIMKDVKAGEIKLNDINENFISKRLYTKISDPDLLIRTSGEYRLSDFLMWQTSHTCIHFMKVLWPEFSAWNFISAVFYYQRCYRDISKLINDLKIIKLNENDDIICNIGRFNVK